MVGTDPASRPADETIWGCSNCHHTQSDAPENATDTCPECKVEQMQELGRETCPNDCGSKLEVYATTEGGFSTLSIAKCPDCESTGEIDDDGIWWWD